MHFSFGEAAGPGRLSARQVKVDRRVSDQLLKPRFFSDTDSEVQFRHLDFWPAAVRNAFTSGGVATPNVWKLLFGEANQRVLSCRRIPESR
jgi:hypothetical protein